MTDHRETRLSDDQFSAVPLWRLLQPLRVSSGGVNLFAVRVEADAATGRRMPLLRLDAGAVLWPTPVAAGWGILACAGQDSTLETTGPDDRERAAWDGAVSAAIEAGGGTVGDDPALDIARMMERRQSEMTARIAQRTRHSRDVLYQGYEVLAQVIAPDRPSTAAVGPGDGDMLVVARVARALGAGVTAPPHDITLPGGHGRVGAILRASGLRHRVVLLRDGWWRQEGGVLIAWRGAGRQAVALLPGPGGYRLWAPEHEGEVVVDAPLAAELEPQAVTVYPRFGLAALTPRAIAALALRGTRADALRLAVLALGTALLGLLVPVASSLLVDEIIPAADRGQLLVLVLGLAVAALTSTALELTKGIALLRLEGRVDATVQAALFDRLLRLPAAFFKRFTAGDLTDRVLGIQAIRQKLAGAVVSSLLGGVFSLLSLGMLFFYSRPLALLALALALLSALITAGLIWRQLRQERLVAGLRGGVEGVVLQIIMGVGKLAAAAARDRALAHWASLFARQKRHALAAKAAARAQAVFLAMFPPLVNALVFAVMAMLAKETLLDNQMRALVGGEAQAVMGTGAFLAFNAALAQFLTAMTQSVHALSDLLGVVPLWERSRPLVEEPPEESGQRHSPGALLGGIEFSGVGFSYGPGGVPVLGGVSVTIRPGEYVALVGPSGSGKSTLIRLLLGLGSPGEGEIFLDGKPLSRLTLSHVRAQIGVVLQTNRILPGDVFANIVGSSGARLEEAWEAAALVGLEADIRAMPMGMHTVLMEGGATLSGGQRQRLAIARALVRRPRILVLDEATSALDNRTQAIVTRSLGQLGITRILIAHRLSTITGVDRVLVMDQGRLVQVGRHDDLIQAPGLFAEMARRQIL